MTKIKILEELGKVKVKLQKDFQIKKLGVFGSVTRTEDDDYNDLDIVVELDKADMFDLIGIKQELEDRFDTKVDIVRLRDRMNEFLRKRIEQEAIYV